MYFCPKYITLSSYLHSRKHFESLWYYVVIGRIQKFRLQTWTHLKVSAKRDIQWSSTLTHVYIAIIGEPKECIANWKNNRTLHQGQMKKWLVGNSSWFPIKNTQKTHVITDESMKRYTRWPNTITLNKLSENSFPNNAWITLGKKLLKINLWKLLSTS